MKTSRRPTTSRRRRTSRSRSHSKGLLEVIRVLGKYWLEIVHPPGQSPMTARITSDDPAGAGAPDRRRSTKIYLITKSLLEDLPGTARGRTRLGGRLRRRASSRASAPARTTSTCSTTGSDASDGIQLLAEARAQSESDRRRHPADRARAQYEIDRQAIRSRRRRLPGEGPARRHRPARTLHPARACCRSIYEAHPRIESRRADRKSSSRLNAEPEEGDCPGAEESRSGPA